MPPAAGAEAAAPARKKKQAEPNAQATVAQRLAAYGEQFMDSFGGGGEKKRKKAPAREPVQRAAAAAEPAAAQPAAAKRRPATATAAPAAASDELDALFARSSGFPSASAPRVRAPLPAQGVTTAVFDGRRVQRYAVGETPPPPAPPPPKRAHHDDRPEPGSAAEDAALARAFKAIQKEVESFGAGGLDGRERKAWEAKRLVSLGMSAPKRPRIPANIGFGMAAKAAGREEAARLEDAAVNGGRLAKKKKKAPPSGGGGASEARERGVAWGAGADTFRGGMLHLGTVPPKQQAEQRRGGALSGGFDGVFKSGGGKRGKGGKRGGSKRKGR